MKTLWTSSLLFMEWKKHDAVISLTSNGHFLNCVENVVIFCFFDPSWDDFRQKKTSRWCTNAMWNFYKNFNLWSKRIRFSSNWRQVWYFFKEIFHCADVIKRKISSCFVQIWHTKITTEFKIPFLLLFWVSTIKCWPSFF